MGWISLRGVASGVYILASVPTEAASSASAWGQGFASFGNVVLSLSTVLVIFAVTAVAWFGRKGVGAVPSSGLGAFLESVYDFVGSFAQSFMGEQGERYVPFAMSLFLFVLMSNWAGLLPVPKAVVQGHEHALLEPPTASYNTTLALAIVTVVGFTFYGLKRKISGDTEAERKEAEEVAKEMAVERAKSNPEAGTDPILPHFEERHGLFKGFFVWLSHYLHPVPDLWNKFDAALRYSILPLLTVLFCGLNIIEELGRLVSLSFRLYGNINGEHVVKSTLLSVGTDFFNSIVPAVHNSSTMAAIQGVVFSIALWGVSFFVTCIGALSGFVQALVFCLLTLNYISHVVVSEEE